MQPDKEILLSSVTDLSQKNLLTKAEIIAAFDKGKGNNTRPRFKDIGVSEVLYIIGGFILVIGVSVLVWNNWDLLNAISKILLTLGFGLVTFFCGAILNKEEKYGALGYAFHLIAAFLLPLGIGVVFYQAGYDVYSNGMQSIIALLSTLMYLGSSLYFRKAFFTGFTIAYATWLFIVFTNFLTGPNPLFADFSFYEYRFLFIGLSYMLLGYHFDSSSQKELKGILLGLGVLFFLGAGILLGGWSPTQNIIWELIYPGFLFAVILLSVYLKAKSFLLFGTLFLMMYIFKITSEYFTGTLGWPFSLMICGLALIFCGYFAFSLNKKYLSS